MFGEGCVADGNNEGVLEVRWSRGSRSLTADPRRIDELIEAEGVVAGLPMEAVEGRLRMLSFMTREEAPVMASGAGLVMEDPLPEDPKIPPG